MEKESEKITLLPCPCCGAEAMKRNDGYWIRPNFITCRSCGLSTMGCATEREAIQKWNERTK